MNKEDRNKIRQHHVELVELTKLDSLLPRLIQKRVFTESMSERFKNNLITERDRKCDLYLSIQKRGPTAFARLIEALEETAHYNLVRLLTTTTTFDNNTGYISESQLNNSEINPTEISSSPPETSQHVHPYVLPRTSNNNAVIESVFENGAQVDMSIAPLNIIVKPATQFYDDMSDTEETKYPMRSDKRGVYLIINNIEFVNNCEEKRIGAEVDHKNLLELFKQMGFVGQDYMNLEKHVMERVIANFATNDELLNRTDSCIVVVMSHGNDDRKDGFVFSHDHNTIYLSWITECFNNRNCPLLRDIPKIFIFQCCRGDVSDISFNNTPILRTPKQMVDSGGIIARAMPTCSDMLICHSTVPGFQSYREEETGTWYINIICNVWAEYACNTDVEKLMKIVAVKFRTRLTADNKMQTPYYENISFNTCYFHPGLYVS